MVFFAFFAALRFRGFGTALFFAELHCRRVHAVPQPGWLWPVIENMAEMGVASAADDLGPFHEQRIVRHFRNIFRGNRFPEAWPSSPRFILLFRTEQIVAAADTAVDALFMIIPGCPAK